MRHSVHRAIAHADGTMLTLDDGRAVQVAARPDTSGASVVHTALRRVMHVDVAVEGGLVSTSVRGIGHRRTCTLPISLETGLALAMQGCPCSIELPEPEASRDWQAEVMPA